MKPTRRLAALTLGLCALAGCATGPTADPRDPLEPFNRGMTSFNETVDKAVLKPVATAYTEVLPSPVRTGVNNFFANLGDAWSFVNNVLQLRAKPALNSLVRFNVNTFFGFGGVLDIATEMRIERNKQDFGLTLARWGVPSGPYLVLPFLGPSTLRDTAGLPADWYGDLARQIDPVSDRNMLYALRIVDTRASLLNAGNVLEGAALDKYSFTRDAYLQMRAQRAQKPGADAGNADEGRLPPEPEE